MNCLVCNTKLCLPICHECLELEALKELQKLRLQIEDLKRQLARPRKGRCRSLGTYPLNFPI